MIGWILGGIVAVIVVVFGLFCWVIFRSRVMGGMD
jgi:hypothetical protein